MRKIITLTLLAVAFLGGYYLGHQPESPDIFTWAEETYAQLSKPDNQVVAGVQTQVGALQGDQPSEAEAIVVEVGGKLYTVGARALASVRSGGSDLHR